MPFFHQWIVVVVSARNSDNAWDPQDGGGWAGDKKIKNQKDREKEKEHGKDKEGR